MTDRFVGYDYLEVEADAFLGNDEQTHVPHSARA